MISYLLSLAMAFLSLSSVSANDSSYLHQTQQFRDMPVHAVNTKDGVVMMVDVSDVANAGITNIKKYLSPIIIIIGIGMAFFGVRLMREGWRYMVAFCFSLVYFQVITKLAGGTDQTMMAIYVICAILCGLATANAVKDGPPDICYYIFTAWSGLIYGTLLAIFLRKIENAATFGIIFAIAAGRPDEGWNLKFHGMMVFSLLGMTIGHAVYNIATENKQDTVQLIVIAVCGCLTAGWGFHHHRSDHHRSKCTMAALIGAYMLMQGITQMTDFLPGAGRWDFDGRMGCIIGIGCAGYIIQRRNGESVLIN